MNKKTNRILAIIALVFVGIFTISFIMFLFDPKLWGGAVAVIALISGVIGLGLFAVVKAYQKRFNEQEAAEKEAAENNDEETVNTENSDEEKTDIENNSEEKN